MYQSTIELGPMPLPAVEVVDAQLVATMTPFFATGTLQFDPADTEFDGYDLGFAQAAMKHRWWTYRRGRDEAAGSMLMDLAHPTKLSTRVLPDHGGAADGFMWEAEHPPMPGKAPFRARVDSKSLRFNLRVGFVDKVRQGVVILETNPETKRPNPPHEFYVELMFCTALLMKKPNTPPRFLQHFYWIFSARLVGRAPYLFAENYKPKAEDTFVKVSPVKSGAPRDAAFIAALVGAAPGFANDAFAKTEAVTVSRRDLSASDAIPTPPPLAFRT